MAMNGLPESALADFVYHEARLLDEKRFDEWYELFTQDARYWMPLTRGQPYGETITSLFYEDQLLLKVRIERLRHPNAFSQQQPSFCQHILQRPRWKKPSLKPAVTWRGRRSYTSKHNSIATDARGRRLTIISPSRRAPYVSA